MKEISAYENYHLKLLQILEENPYISQREVSDTLGLSLGKVNYILKAFLEKGVLKMQNFKNNQNKLGYAYLLTPHGIEEKARITIDFFERKKKEYEELMKEMERLGLG